MKTIAVALLIALLSGAAAQACPSTPYSAQHFWTQQSRWTH